MLNCEYTSEIDNQIFSLLGKLDQESYLEFDQVVKKNYVKNLNVILDLKNLDYISSVGLRSFIILAKLTRGNKKAINVKVKPGSMVEQLIKLSGFTKIMPFID